MATQVLIRPISDNPKAPHYLIFFITGNPGLIQYYDAFLKTLHQLLSEAPLSQNEVFHIFGQSLAGFEDNDTPVPSTGYPHTLEDQITSRLQLLEDQRIPAGPRQGEEYDGIILIGHSVGTYMLLELLQRLRKSGSSLKVKGGVLLMPTVMGLAESPSGVKSSPMFRIGGFPWAFSRAAKGLIWLTPRSALKWVVSSVLGMPEDGAETTARFLTSSMGVWQALHLAADEMRTITVDKWDDDIWGIENAGPKSDIPKLFFYFAEKDHWVADHTRDTLIAARGKKVGEKSSKPEMAIDSNGIGHAFCLKYGETVAEIVKPWIDEIITASVDA